MSYSSRTASISIWTRTVKWTKGRQHLLHRWLKVLNDRHISNHLRDLSTVISRITHILITRSSYNSFQLRSTTLVLWSLTHNSQFIYNYRKFISFPRDKKFYDYTPEPRKSHICIKVHNWRGTKCLSTLKIRVPWVVAAVRMDIWSTIRIGCEGNRDPYLKKGSKLLLHYRFYIYLYFLGIISTLTFTFLKPSITICATV